MQATLAKAKTIADSVSPQIVGIFPILIIISIITSLLPEIIKCFAPKPAPGPDPAPAPDPVAAKEYVHKRFNPAKASDEFGGYRPLTVKIVMDRVRKAEVKQPPMNGGKMSEQLTREIAIKTLNDIRTGDNEHAQACINEAMAMPV